MPTETDELTTRVDGVELIGVGTHDASTGKARITAGDLAAMVEAFNDPKHDAAPVKLGHDDDRFQDAEGNPPSRRDGQPAYGWVENLRLSADKRTLIGDLVGVPRMLAEIMATAFRRRSVELVRQERIGAKVYSAVLTGLSLLGVQPPAVKGLADLRALFAEQLDAGPMHETLLISDGDTPPVPQTTPRTTQREPQTLSSSSETSGVVMRLNKHQRAALGIPDGATTEQVKGILAKKGLQMAEGENYEEDNEEITLPATPPEVTPPATPISPPAPVASAPPTAPAVEPAVPEKVAASKELPTAEAIMLAASQFGLTVVDQERFTALQADAQAGRQARDEQNNLRWDSIIQQAVRQGKLATTAFSLWRKKIAENPTLVIELLAAMPEGELPTSPLGHAEAYAGGLPGDEDSQAAVSKAAHRKLADYFSIPELAKD